MNFDTNPNFFSSSSIHRGVYPPSNSSKDATKSKAYLNAMRSLQEKIKELEKEKASWLNEKQEIISTVESEYQEIMKQYRKEIDEYLTKELDYKEKIRMLESKNLENESKIDDFEARNNFSESETEKKIQGVNRELIEMKTRLQEEIQINEDLRSEIQDLNQKNNSISEENERNLKDFKEEREGLEEKLTDIEGKYQVNLLEIQELKGHYSHEINEYQEELLRIQDKYQRELETLLQEKDQLILENRRFFNELNLKDEDLTMLKRKFENLTMEKKKDDMYKQIMTEFQMSRDNSALFLRNPNESRTTFANNVSEIIMKKKADSIKKKRNPNLSSSSEENSEIEDRKSTKKKENDRKKKGKEKKNEDNTSEKSSESEDLEFFQDRERQNMQDFQKNFKEIVTLENEIKQTNQKYENLMMESQASLDSQEKAKIRQKLFVLNETLNKANEKLLSLKKLQSSIKN